MKRHAPATARNSLAIAEELERELPSTGMVLEVASGSGEHSVFFARRFPALTWQPSDTDAEALASVAAWGSEAGLPNLLAPVALNASQADWPVTHADALLCINMAHIAPWSASEGLFAGAARVLNGDAPLILYGPFLENGVEAAASNRAFDESLRGRDPRWGLRRVEELDRLAARRGLVRTARLEMPANNLTLVWRKRSTDRT